MATAKLVTLADEIVDLIDDGTFDYVGDKTVIRTDVKEFNADDVKNLVVKVSCPSQQMQIATVDRKWSQLPIALIAIGKKLEPGSDDAAQAECDALRLFAEQVLELLTVSAFANSDFKAAPRSVDAGFAFSADEMKQRREFQTTIAVTYFMFAP